MLRLRRRAPFALAVCLAELAAYDLLQLFFFLRAGHVPDFRLFWGAARAVLAGGPGAVYALQPGAPWPYLNPPVLAWILVPLALLPFPVAFAAWFAAGAAALLLAARAAGTGRLGMLSAVAFLPTFVALGSGQVAPLVLLALALAAAALGRGRWLAAGLLLSALAVKPQLGLLVPVAVLATGRWRPVAVLAAAAAAVGAATLAALGPGGVASWAADLAAFGSNPYFLRWSVAAYAGPSAWLAAAALATLLVALGAHRHRDDPQLAVGLGVAASILVNHYLTPSDLVVLLLPAWALVRAGGVLRGLGVLLWAAGWLALWLPPLLLGAEALVLLAAALPLPARAPAPGRPLPAAP